ncbi:M48 family metalloprotease [bacterium]|nr:M48 family metalloprotease [bacterium]
MKTTTSIKCFGLQYLFAQIVIGLLGLLPSTSSLSADIELPLLGDSTSGIVSKQQEYELGRLWLKSFRSRVRGHEDPLMQQYLEELLYNLATHSDLEDPRLELIIVKNPSMNAFAVPGGVVGFHTGVFAAAENEDQMTSVLAHELAHLSQRHFARRIEAQRASSIFSMAGLLASLVIAATVGGDAGMAAISSTQAMTLQGQLRYSRSNEQEADRMGMQTMKRASRDPGAVAGMFETMLKATRYNGTRLPEFLLSHPITEKRISDARGRAMADAMRHYIINPEYFLIQARAIVAMEKDPRNAIKTFQARLDNNAQNPNAAKYGLALAYIESNQFAEARALLTELIEENPDSVTFRHGEIELDIASGNYNDALAKLDQLIRINPNNYPLMMLKAEALWQRHSYEEAGEVFSKLSRMRPEDPAIWYQLAEVRGLAGNISGVHQARAEYFILVGAFGKARDQLTLAVKLVAVDFKRSAIIRQRLKDIATMEDNLEKL